MNGVILCEGKIENVVLDSYLIKIGKWEDYQIDPSFIKEQEFDIKFERSRRRIFYKGNKKLYRFSISGAGNMKKAIDLVLEHNENRLDNNKIFNKIIIIRDCDDIPIGQLLQSFNDTFNRKGFVTKIENGVWKNCEFLIKYLEEKIEIDVLALLIPPNECGAMETFLLNCIRLKYENIVSQCVEFVLKINPKGYFKNEGLKRKAEFWTTMSIKYPKRQLFDSFRMLNDMPWEEYEGFGEGFKELANV